MKNYQISPVHTILKIIGLPLALLTILSLNQTLLAQIQTPDGFADTQDKRQHPPTPQESLAKITVPEGFKVTLFCGEPDIPQPISITTDARGRLWVAQCFTSPNWVDTETGPDRIWIFEDKNNDGVFDEKKLFADNLPNLTSIELGLGGVWACCAPNLLFIPDRDRDDKPDGPAEIKLDGWLKPSHNIYNGLTWGPDGWLYGCHGILGTSVVGKPGTPEAERMQINCGVWRYHPQTEKCEAVCHGTTNPWGLDFDEQGNGFFTNCVIGHLWQMIPGAYYKRMFGEHFSPYVYEVIDTCADHRHWEGDWTSSRFGIDQTDFGGGHAHAGAMIYLGSNWPKEYRGAMMTCNIHGNRVNCDQLKSSLYGFTATHYKDPLLANDPWFRGLELIYGPDGGVYISDWSDFGECHDNDGVLRSSGRIYKSVYQKPNPVDANLDLYKLSNAELVGLQTHENDWYPRWARRILQERAYGGEKVDLTSLKDESLTGDSSTTIKLRYLWTLYLTGNIDEAFLLKLSKLKVGDDNYALQGWAIRLLMDSGQVSDKSRDRFVQMAAESNVGMNDVHLASAMRFMPVSQRFAMATSLAKKCAEVTEPELRLMIWYGIEPIVAANPALALKLAEGEIHPSLRQFIIRRLVEDKGEMRLAEIITAIGQIDSQDLRRDFLGGLRLGLQKHAELEKPAAWDAIFAKLIKSNDGQTVYAAAEIGARLEDPAAKEKLIAIVTGKQGEFDQQLLNEGVAFLAANKTPGFDDQLLEDIESAATTRLAAIRGLTSYDNRRTAPVLIMKYDGFNDEEKQAAIATLSTNARDAAALLDAVDTGKIPALDIPAYTVRQISAMKNKELEAKLAEIWPVARAAQGDREQQIKKYKAILGDEYTKEKYRSGNGREIFNKICGKCHKLHGEGGELGPELTGSGRKDLDYILQNIIDPSAMVERSFRMTIVDTLDGKTYSGFIAEQNDEVIKLRTPEGEIILKRANIDSMSPTKFSIMPDGILDQLTPEQVRMLVAYLTS